MTVHYDAAKYDVDNVLFCLFLLIESKTRFMGRGLCTALKPVCSSTSICVSGGPNTIMRTGILLTLVAPRRVGDVWEVAARKIIAAYEVGKQAQK